MALHRCFLRLLELFAVFDVSFHVIEGIFVSGGPGRLYVVSLNHSITVAARVAQVALEHTACVLGY